MIPLPFKKFYIETSLSPDEVASQLHHNIETDKLNKFLAGVAIRNFEGQLTYDNASNRYKFELYRLTNNWKSFPSEIRGTISELNGKTQLEISLEMNFIHLLLLTCWSGFVLLALIGQTLTGDFSLFPLVILFLGFPLFALTYFPEAIRDKDLLLAITQGKAVNRKTGKRPAL